MFKNLNLRNHRLIKLLAIFSIPYIVLILLHIINPLLSEGSYCPRASVLEDNIWIFPSPIIHWKFYAFGFLILFALTLVIRRIVKAVKNRKALEIDPIEQGPSTFKIIAPFFWIIMGMLAVGFVVAVVESAGSSYRYFGEFLYGLINYINVIMIPISLLIASIMFLVGAYQYFIPGLDGNMIARRTGRIRMFFSILIGFLIIVFWGVVNLLSSSTGLDGGSIQYASQGGTGFSYSLSTPNLGSVFNETIGFAVGGAKDADNFRENIEQCYLPVPTDITYEGLFYDYNFDSRNQTGCTALFCPQYESAVIADPFSGKDEYFLSVGLASNIDVETFTRPPLDLVVVLDISGSMSGSFDRYYYDKFRDPNAKPKDADWNISKMEVAKEALGAMVDRLHPDDRFGLVIYDSYAETLLEPFTMGQNGYAKAKNAVFTLQPRGGTNMEAGLEEGTQLIKSLTQEEGVDRERRIIFLTDAMPNTGAIEQNDLYIIGQRNASENIHTTFIGVGVDFNTELVEALTKQIPGANYYSIHSSTDFERRLDTEFEYMVAPLVYDLTLTIDAGDYEIRTVYGSPEAHLATGEMLRVSTLFPSPTSEGSSRGSIILAHMKKVGNTGATTNVTAAYTDRSGERHVESGIIDWSAFSGDGASSNMRKAVLLSRYVNLLQNWIIDENERQGKPEKTIYLPVRPYYTFYQHGLVIPVERYPEGSNTTYIPHELNYWERLSRELVVSEDYKVIIKDFRKYMEREMEYLDEQDKLQLEVELLRNLEQTPDSYYKEEEAKFDAHGREI